MNKLLLLTALCIASFASLTTYGQDSLYTRNRRTITIGFQVGQRYMFKSPLASLHKFSGKGAKYCCRTYSEGMFLKRYLTEHLAVESGLEYQAAALPSRTVAAHSKNYSITIPTTAQYYILPANRKMNTYVGAGIDYNISRQTVAPKTSLDGMRNNITNTTGMNISIVQGIIYEVNTKIQVRESIHFMPNSPSGCQQIGFNIGIGFNF